MKKIVIEREKKCGHFGPPPLGNIGLNFFIIRNTKLLICFSISIGFYEGCQLLYTESQTFRLTDNIMYRRDLLTLKDIIGQIYLDLQGLL